MKTSECIQKSEQYLLHTYNRAPVVWERGEGVRLYDADGKEYLDFAAGIAVYALGYGNPAYREALKDQIDKIIHTSNLYYNVPQAIFSLPATAGWCTRILTGSCCACSGISGREALLTIIN